MIDYIISPGTSFFCFFIAVTFFRRENVTVTQALMLPLQRAALNFKVKFTDVFTLPGIAFLLAGSMIALLDVALI